LDAIRSEIEWSSQLWTEAEAIPELKRHAVFHLRAFHANYLQRLNETISGALADFDDEMPSLEGDEEK
jgi:hypothetical protein